VTGTNVSPVVGLFDDDGRVAPFVEAAVGRARDAEVTDDAGVRHRMWAVPDDGELDVSAVASALGAGPITIADGHHRYETALRYRDERRMTRSCEEDPAFDYVLALLLDARQALTVLPTHRIVRGLSGDERARLADRLPELFEVTSEPRSADELVARWTEAEDPTPEPGTVGFLAPDASFLLRARPDAFTPAVAGLAPPLAGLDVVLLGVALERLLGIGADEVAAGRVQYTHDAAEAARAVGDGDVAFLLRPTPVRAVVDVAAAGEVMPQKSTYFYPKALTGLVLNPHEW
jgi:uncharacterized protein (DUF1015 family)